MRTHTLPWAVIPLTHNRCTSPSAMTTSGNRHCIGRFSADCLLVKVVAVAAALLLAVVHTDSSSISSRTKTGAQQADLICECGCDCVWFLEILGNIYSYITSLFYRYGTISKNPLQYRFHAFHTHSHAICLHRNCFTANRHWIGKFKYISDMFAVSCNFRALT